MSKIILKKEINVLKDLLNNLDNFPKEKSPKGIGQLSKIKFSIIRYSLSNGKEVNVFLGEPKEKKIDKIPAIIFHTGANRKPIIPPVIETVLKIICSTF